jgi:hypothetical protein
VVVLDRIEPGQEPPYCAHGRATCVACPEWVWLGNKTVEAVLSGEVDPICLPCAIRLFPKGATALGQIDDHRRADGPHE